MKKISCNEQMDLFSNTIESAENNKKNQKSKEKKENVVCLRSIRDQKHRSELIENLWRIGLLGKRRA